MNREILFRGKRVDNGGWVYGFVSIDRYSGKATINNTVMYHSVIPETVGQFTGLKDNTGTKIFEGDLVLYRQAYRTTQTHTGDNIPNGSYTEPCEPGIKAIEGEVLFDNGMFYLDTDGDQDFTTPLGWLNQEFNIDDIKESISWTRQTAGWFDDPEEGDLNYLIKEVAKVENEEQLLNFINGFEITGNIHDNPTK